MYIDDVVRANLVVFDPAADFPEPIFNIGTGIETTLNAIYWKVAEILGAEPKPIYHPDRPGGQIRYCLERSKAHTNLGWSPQMTLEEGLRRTVKASRVSHPRVPQSAVSSPGR